MKVKILYIEDEEFLGRIVKETIEKEGFEVYWEKDGALVMSSFNRFQPDLVVLDIMLPNTDGYTLCEQIHAANPGMPIIFLTAKTETADLVRGFESGGSDYMKKPFSMEELMVRIRHWLELMAGIARPSKIEDQVQLGKFLFQPNRYELSGPSGTIKLSHREMEILQMLAINRNQVTDRRELLQTVWGDDSFFNSGFVSINLVDDVLSSGTDILDFSPISYFNISNSFLLKIYESGMIIPPVIVFPRPHVEFIKI